MKHPPSTTTKFNFNAWNRYKIGNEVEAWPDLRHKVSPVECSRNRHLCNGGAGMIDRTVAHNPLFSEVIKLLIHVNSAHGEWISCRRLLDWAELRTIMNCRDVGYIEFETGTHQRDFLYFHARLTAKGKTKVDKWIARNKYVAAFILSWTQHPDVTAHEDARFAVTPADHQALE